MVPDTFSPPALHRLTLLFGAWAFVSLGVELAAAGDDTSPIGSVRVDEPITIEESQGDTWVTAWAKDGHLYSPSNDTFGFRRAGNANIAFNRLEGDDVRRLHGTSVNMMADYGKSAELGPDGCSWKSSGCYAVDGVLYWVVARHKYGESSGDPKMRQTAENASILKSTDGGTTWSRPVKENYEHPTFPGRRFAAPYFIEYGRDGEATVDNADRYVYALSNNGFWDNGDHLILGRVARSKLAALHGSDWEFYRGGDGMEDVAWNADNRRAKLVLDAPGKLGMTGAVFIPALNRYLLIGWYYPAGGGKLKDASPSTIWDFYESPKPWGPWTMIGSKQWHPQGYYSPQICPKFTSRDGGRLFAVTAGDWTNSRVYHLTIVPIHIAGRGSEKGSETGTSLISRQGHHTISQQTHLRASHGVGKDSLERFVIFRLVKYLHPGVCAVQHMVRKSPRQQLLMLVPCLDSTKHPCGRQ